MVEARIAELITRRRRQILVHSVIYYRLNANVISDSQWSEWAVELEKLQKQYPEIAAQCPYAEEYEDFDHSSGYNLPLGDPWANRTANMLVKIHQKKLKENHL